MIKAILSSRVKDLNPCSTLRATLSVNILVSQVIVLSVGAEFGYEEESCDFGIGILKQEKSVMEFGGERSRKAR